MGCPPVRAHAKREAFDLDAARWVVPASRMKTARPHRVFPSRQAAEILRPVQMPTGHGQYVLPGMFRGRVPMYEATLGRFFMRMGFGVREFSPHGARAGCWR